MMSADVEVAGPLLTVRDVPLAFGVMAKPTGAICSLDCEYRFLLSKEMLYPDSRVRIAEELQETYTRRLREGHERAPEVVATWQAREPTIMGMDFFCRSVSRRDPTRMGLRRRRPWTILAASASRAVRARVA